jgi:Tol biopolymer transport system component
MSPEQTIAHYRIVSKLGEGGMGAVYRATDTKLNRDVAIKVLPDALANDADYVARFTREAQVLASLNHPNIAIIHGVEERALVMELVPGTTLEERIAAGPIAIAEALGIARQIADALDAAHEKGVIHRDLKPANIKVTPEGVVKVLDFGLAKAADPVGSASTVNSPTLTMRATQAGAIMGTAGYMAPEQAAGKAVDKRADIWSFGVVLFEMLTGTRLFDGETIAHTLAHVLTREIDLNAVDPALLPLVRRCLQRDPRKRLRDIGDARLAIDEYLADPPLAPVAAVAATARASKIPWLVAAALAAALAVTVVAASRGWFGRATETLQPLVRFDIQPGPDTDPASLMRTLAISPDGQRIVYGTRSGSTTRLSSWLVDQAVGVPIPGSEDARTPTFSHDGEWIAVVAGDGSGGKLRKIPLRGGVPQNIVDGALTGLGWGPDGIYYRTGTRSPILMMPVTGAPAPRAATQFVDKDATHRYPQSASGGRILLFTNSTHGGNYEDAEIVALDLKSGRRVTLWKNAYYGRYVGPDEGPGFLLALSKGTILARAMDPLRLSVGTTAAPVLEGVACEPTNGYASFDVSRDGTLVYVKGSAQPLPRLQMVDSAGKFTPLTPATGSHGAVRVSPDGKRLLYWQVGTDVNDLWTIDLALGTATRMTFGGQGASPGAWSHDGRHIAYGGQGKIWWLRSDGGGQPQAILDEPPRRAAVTSVASDGRQMLLSDGVTIFTVSLEDAGGDRPRAGEPKVFLKSSDRLDEPGFSPDGKWIAYSSNESGRREVYVTAFPGPGGKSQISRDGGTRPAWTRNEIFFEDANLRLYAAPYTVAGDGFRVGPAKPWGNVRVNGLLLVRNFDVMPDGKRVVALNNDESESDAKLPGQISVVLHFFDELVRKIGRK